MTNSAGCVFYHFVCETKPVKESASNHWNNVQRKRRSHQWGSLLVFVNGMKNVRQNAAMSHRRVRAASIRSHGRLIVRRHARITRIYNVFVFGLIPSVNTITCHWRRPSVRSGWGRGGGPAEAASSTRRTLQPQQERSEHQPAQLRWVVVALQLLSVTSYSFCVSLQLLYIHCVSLCSYFVSLYHFVETPL